MNKSPIKREAQGVTVTLWVDGWPRAATIQKTDERDIDKQFRLFTSEQIRGLYWCLGEIIAADPQPD